METYQNHFIGGAPFQSFKNAGFHIFRPGWHWDSTVNYAAFYLIREGELTVSGRRGTVVLRENDVLFLPAGDSRLFENSGDGQLGIHFVSFRYDERYDLGIRTVFRETDCRPLFEEVMNAHRSDAPCSRLQVAASFFRLLHTLAKRSLPEAERLPASIELAAKYIQTHYYKKITEADLCRISGYSPAHLRRLFQKNLGMPPAQYIRYQRIEIAKGMLTDFPEMSTDEVAAAVGLCSASYFCKLFKEQTGVTPHAFRAVR